MTDRMTNAEIEAICGGLEAVLASPAGRDMYFVRDALTAIRQLQNPWMPIETAPRDGTLFIAECLCATTGQHYVLTDVSWWRQANPWISIGDGEVNALRWQPMPPAPETGE